VLGDDVTDEGMFRSLGPNDESVRVGADAGRATAARWRLDGPDAARAFLAWILAVRRGAPAPKPPPLPRRLDAPVAAAAAPFPLLVVSNRLPELPSAAESFDPRHQNV